MARALAALVALSLLAGCGDREDGPVRLQVFGDPVELAAYRELIQAYESRNPGAKVELVPVGKQRDHMAKLATAFAAGDPPDLFVLNFRRFGQLAAKDVLTPLGPALEAQGLLDEDDFYEPALEAFQWNGALACLPQNVSSLVVYYNRKLFRDAKVEFPKAGWGMGDMARAALEVRKKARDAEGFPPYGLAFEPSLIRIAPFIWAFGGELVDDTQKPTRFLLGGSAPSALRFVHALRGLYAVTPSLRDYKAEDHEARFVRGGLAMLLQSRRFTATLRAEPKLDWDVAPFPVAQGRKPATVLHADAYCQAADARDPAAAQRFAAFAVSADGQSILARSGRIVPSRKSVAESPVFLDPKQPPASAKVFLEAIPHLRRTPNIAAWHEIESKADVLLDEWYYEVGGAGEEGEGMGLTPYVLFATQLRQQLQPLLAVEAAP